MSRRKNYEKLADELRRLTRAMHRADDTDQRDAAHERIVWLERELEQQPVKTYRITEYKKTVVYVEARNPEEAKECAADVRGRGMVDSTYKQTCAVVSDADSTWVAK